MNNDVSRTLASGKATKTMQTQAVSLLKRPSTFLGKLLESKENQDCRDGIAADAKELGLKARKTEVDQAVRTIKLQSDMAHQQARDQALATHHQEVSRMKLAADEQAAKAVIRTFESKRDQSERISEIDCDQELRALAKYVCDEIHVRAAQETINRVDDAE